MLNVHLVEEIFILVLFAIVSKNLNALWLLFYDTRLRHLLPIVLLFYFCVIYTGKYEFSENRDKKHCAIPSMLVSTSSFHGVIIADGLPSF